MQYFISWIMDSNLTRITLVEMSIKLTAELTPGYFIRFFLGLIGAAFNFTIIFVILRSKCLHTKFMINVACCAAFDMLYCEAHVTIGAFGIYRSFAQVGVITTPFQCVSSMWIYLYLMNAAHTQVIVLALDRFAAVVMPIWYQRVHTAKYVVCGVLATTVSTIAWPLLELVQAKNDPLLPYPVCASASPLYKKVYLPISIGLCCIAISMCIATMLILCVRTRKSHCKANVLERKQKNVTQKLQIKMIYAVGLHSGIYASSWFAYIVCTNVYRNALPSIYTYNIGYIVLATLISPLFSFPMYLLMLKRFKIEFVKLVQQIV